MQDDFYQIAADGWKAELVWTERGKRKKKVWDCDLLPKELAVAKYFAKDAAKIRTLEEKCAAVEQEMASLLEETAGRTEFSPSWRP